MVVLKDGHHRPRKRDARTVQRVHELALQVGFAPELDHCSPRLEVFEVAARRHFEPLIPRWRICLYVIGLRRMEPKAARAKQPYPIGQVESSHYCLGVRKE